MPIYHDSTTGIVAEIGANGRVINVTKYDPKARLLLDGAIAANISVTVGGINRPIADVCAVRNGVMEGN